MHRLWIKVVTSCTKKKKHVLTPNFRMIVYITPASRSALYFHQRALLPSFVISPWTIFPITHCPDSLWFDQFHLCLVIWLNSTYISPVFFAHFLQSLVCVTALISEFWFLMPWFSIFCLVLGFFLFARVFLPCCLLDYLQSDAKSDSFLWTGSFQTVWLNEPVQKTNS